MKKISKILVTALALTLVLTAIPMFASADVLKVTLRVEGTEGNLFYGEITLDSAEEVTAADIIDKAAEENESLTVEGASVGYITSVNGVAGGVFGGWDGWLYRVNGLEPSVGVNEYAVSDGDSIVLYYGDPFGVGMQYPELDTSDIANGVISVYSSDTVYDENWNATTVNNPVSGAVLTFDGTEYTTDEEGKVTVDASLLTAGKHSVQIEKTAENGCPLVLRFAPDAVVEIADEPAEPVEPKTGDISVDIFVFAAIALIAIFAAYRILRRRSVNEN